MNANELADDMENGRFNDINYNKKKAADFVRQQQAEIESYKNPIMQAIALAFEPAKTLTDEEILTAIKCIADDVSPHKEYENTYEDGWIDACNTVYDEVFEILRKASEK
jgi:hypothetical protein